MTACMVASLKSSPPLGIHEETPTTKDGFMAESKPLVFRFGDVELRERTGVHPREISEKV